MWSGRHPETRSSSAPPPLELRIEIAQRLAQFSIVGDDGVLANQPFDPL